MGIEKHARMTEDAEAKLLEEAVQTGYRKGGAGAEDEDENGVLCDNAAKENR